MKWFFIAVFFVLVSIFLFEYHLVGQAVYGDGRYYWAITRSLYFSHDIEVSDEMAHLYSPQSNNTDLFFGKVKAYSEKTKFITGGFSLGMTLFWLPFYFLADAIGMTLASVGVPTVRNGYSDIYQITVGIGNILYVLAGLVLLGETLKRWYDKKIVIVSLLLTLFATNLVYYAGFDTINSHPLSFFLVSSLVWLFFQYTKVRDARYLVGMGIVGGLLIGNRRQDIFFLIIPIIAAIFQKNSFSLKKIKIGSTVKNILIVGGSVLLGYLPQLLLINYGQGKPSFYAHTDRAFSYPTHFFEILFDPKLGIVFYMPAFVVGIVGLVLLTRRKRVVWVFLSIIALEVLLLSSWFGWNQAAYSMRYLVSSLPLVAIGLAEVMYRLQRRFSFGFVIICAVSLIFHEFLMILSFKLFLQDPTFVGTELSRSGKLKMQILEQIRNLFFR